MQVVNLDVSVTLTTVECGCGGVYAVNTQLYNNCYENGSNGWHCPYCRATVGWAGKGVAESLRRQLEAERRANKRVQWELQDTKNSLRATKGENTKLKKRTANGVCPCCNRTFQDLHRHMKSKHPEAVKEASNRP